jgi:hypothetical protein
VAKQFASVSSLAALGVIRPALGFEFQEFNPDFNPDTSHIGRRATLPCDVLGAERQGRQGDRGRQGVSVSGIRLVDAVMEKFGSSETMCTDYFFGKRWVTQQSLRPALESASSRWLVLGLPESGVLGLSRLFWNAAARLVLVEVTHARAVGLRAGVVPTLRAGPG